MGNNDTDVPGLTSAFNKIGGELKGEIFETQYDGLNFAVYHGTNFHKKEHLIKSAKYDVFVSGHTHRTLSTTFGKTMVINPGTANGWFLGYKATEPYLILLIDISSLSIYDLNLEGTLS